MANEESHLNPENQAEVNHLEAYDLIQKDHTVALSFKDAQEGRDASPPSDTVTATATANSISPLLLASLDPCRGGPIHMYGKTPRSGKESSVTVRERARRISTARGGIALASVQYYRQILLIYHSRSETNKMRRRGNQNTMKKI